MSTQTTKASPCILPDNTDDNIDIMSSTELRINASDITDISQVINIEAQYLIWRNFRWVEPEALVGEYVLHNLVATDFGCHISDHIP